MENLGGGDDEKSQNRSGTKRNENIRDKTRDTESYGRQRGIPIRDITFPTKQTVKTLKYLGSGVLRDPGSLVRNPVNINGSNESFTLKVLGEGNRGQQESFRVTRKIPTDYQPSKVESPSSRQGNRKETKVGMTKLWYIQNIKKD